MTADVLPGAGSSAALRAGSSAPRRAAIVDRDSGFVRVLANRLQRTGWQLRLLEGLPPVDGVVDLRISAIVIDLATFGDAGWDWLGRLAREMPDLALVVCSRASVAERVRGLRLGADDWLGKPCHPEEVVARLEAIGRRRQRGAGRRQSEGAILAGELEIRADRFQVYVEGRSLELTRREFELLEMFAAAEGHVLEREEIYQRVWGYAMARGDRSVDVFVRKLRQKLESASPSYSYIHTHFGIGYSFSPEPRRDPPAAAPEPAALSGPAGSV